MTKKLSHQISVRVEKNLSQLLEDTAKQHKLSKAKLIRTLLEIGHEQFDRNPDYQHPRTNETMNGLYGNTGLAKDMETAIGRIQKLKKSQNELVGRKENAQKALRVIERRAGLW